MLDFPRVHCSRTHSPAPPTTTQHLSTQDLVMPRESPVVGGPQNGSQTLNETGSSFLEPESF